MKYLGWLIALFVVTAGAFGVVAPDRLIEIGRFIVTPAGLVGIAVGRICIGMALIWIAPGSRVPKVLQVCGAIALLAGLVTPLFGVERARAVLDWEAAQGPLLIRAGATVIVAIGCFLAFAVATPRGSART